MQIFANEFYSQWFYSEIALYTKYFVLSYSLGVASFLFDVQLFEILDHVACISSEMEGYWISIHWLTLARDGNIKACS